MNTKTRHIHMCIDLQAAMKMSDAELVDCFIKDDGTKPTPAEVRREIMLAYNKGYEVVPPCDNVKDDGSCAGHDDG